MDLSPFMIPLGDGSRKNQLILNLTAAKALRIDYIRFGCDRELKPTWHNNRKIYKKCSVEIWL